MNEYEILSALVDVLSDLTGLHAYHYPEPGMQSPCCFPLFEWGFNVDWGSDLGGNSGPIKGEIMVLVAWGAGASRIGARTMADYLSPAGDKSISQKLHGHTLGGLVHPTLVSGLGKIEMVTLPDDRTYWGRPIRVTLYPPL